MAYWAVGLVRSGASPTIDANKAKGITIWNIGRSYPVKSLAPPLKSSGLCEYISMQTLARRVIRFIADE